eukprot:gene20103-22074_t
MKPDAGSKVYVGNLPPRCTEKDLENLCKQFGDVVRADIVKNFGFVIYESKEDAKRAVANLNECDFQNSRLQVEIARSKLHVDDKDDNQCYECGQKGHWARECPKRMANGGRRSGPRGPPGNGGEAYRSRGPPPRDSYSSRGPPPRDYHEYDRGYDRPYDRPPPPRGYDGYDRGPPPPRRPSDYPYQYRPRSRSPPPGRRYPPPRESYGRDPYPRDSYYRDSYGRDDYARDHRPPRYDPYPDYRGPPSHYSSPYEMSQPKRYSPRMDPWATLLAPTYYTVTSFRIKSCQIEPETVNLRTRCALSVNSRQYKKEDSSTKTLANVVITNFVITNVDRRE